MLAAVMLATACADNRIRVFDSAPVNRAYRTDDK